MAPKAGSGSGKKEERYDESDFTKQKVGMADRRMKDKMAERHINVPSGYRFNPSDDELMNEYLLPRINHDALPPNLIHETEFYEHSPVELAEEYAPASNKTWYFFTPRTKKYTNGTRPNRSAKDGYWKATGADQPILRDPELEESATNRKIGAKKSLVFYKGEAMNGEKTNWIMHEYTNVNDPTSSDGTAEFNDFALCKIKLKPDGKKKSKKENRANQSVDVKEEQPSSSVAQMETVQQIQANQSVDVKEKQPSSSVAQMETVQQNLSRVHKRKRTPTNQNHEELAQVRQKPNVIPPPGTSHLNMELVEDIKPLQQWPREELLPHYQAPQSIEDYSGNINKWNYHSEPYYQAPQSIGNYSGINQWNYHSEASLIGIKNTHNLQPYDAQFHLHGNAMRSLTRSQVSQYWQKYNSEASLTGINNTPILEPYDAQSHLDGNAMRSLTSPQVSQDWQTNNLDGYLANPPLVGMIGSLPVLGEVQGLKPNATQCVGVSEPYLSERDDLDKVLKDESLVELLASIGESSEFMPTELQYPMEDDIESILPSFDHAPETVMKSQPAELHKPSSHFQK